MTSFLVIAAIAFVAMEPVTAATHRWVMHGIGEFLHRSHHRRIATRLEANDWYPVMFSAIVIVGFIVGLNRDGFGALVPAGVGVTVYGIAYGLVHDVYIHGRLGGFRGWKHPVLEHLAEAHRIHNLYTAATYGMLAQVVPAELRSRAERTNRNPLVRV